MSEGDTILRANALRPRLAGKRLTTATPERFGRLVGSTVTEVEARSKHLLIHFDNGLVLHSHMRMTGSWHIYGPGEHWRKVARMARVVEDLFNVELRGQYVGAKAGQVVIQLPLPYQSWRRSRIGDEEP